MKKPWRFTNYWLALSSQIVIEGMKGVWGKIFNAKKDVEQTTAMRARPIMFNPDYANPLSPYNVQSEGYSGLVTLMLMIFGLIPSALIIVTSMVVATLGILSIPCTFIGDLCVGFYKMCLGSKDDSSNQGSEASLSDPQETSARGSNSSVFEGETLRFSAESSESSTSNSKPLARETRKNSNGSRRIEH